MKLFKKKNPAIEWAENEFIKAFNNGDIEKCQILLSFIHLYK